MNQEDPNEKIILMTQSQQDSAIQMFQKAHLEMEYGNIKLVDLTSKLKEKILETEITLFGEKTKLTSPTKDASKVGLPVTDGDAHINGDSILIDKNKLDDLISKLEEKILQTKITLFGEKIKLTSLTKVIDGGTLTALINGDSITIGNKHEYDFDTYIDIPRTVTYHTKLDKKCLKENKNDLFAFSGIDEDELSRLVPELDRESSQFILLDNDINFYNLCRVYDTHTIHLLEYKDSVLQWKKSHGSLFNLRRFVLEEDGQKKRINELTNSAIIAGEAGMGKSTLLTTYSMYKDCLWPIRINLKDYQTDIHNTNFDDLSGIVKFLANVVDPASSQTSFIKDLLEYCLKQERQVTLLLDGYDEIKDHIKKKVVQLWRTLITTKAKVFLTTRLHARSELEDALGVFAHSLDPFDEIQQQYFLKKFWIRKLDIKDQPTKVEKIDIFTNQLLNCRELNLIKKEGVVRTVLQTRMLAVVFIDKCKDYLEHEKFDSYELSSMSDLYGRFIEDQYDRYLKENIEINAKIGEFSRPSLTKSYSKICNNLALKSLFSEDQIRGLLSEERFSREKLKEIGIVKILKDDGTADFLHPTYAEYFVADFLVGMLKKDRNHPKYRVAQKLLLMEIFKDHNGIIHDFLNFKILKEHSDDLNEKWTQIQNCDLLGKEESRRIHALGIEHHNVLHLYNILNDFKEATPAGEYHQRMGIMGYFYNYPPRRTVPESDTSLIDILFYSFNREKNVQTLEATLDYLVKTLNKIHYNKAKDLIKNEIVSASKHYLIEAKHQNKLNHELIEKIDPEMNYAYIYNPCLKVPPIPEHLKTLLQNWTISSNESKKHNILDSLDYLVPKHGSLIQLGSLYYSLLTSYGEDIIEKISSCINAKLNKDVQKTYKERMMEFIKNMDIVGMEHEMYKELENPEKIIHLQKFFIDITHNPNFIDDTKSYIDDIFKDKKVNWLQREGIVISGFLKVLTPAMSKKFICSLKISNATDAIYNARKIVDKVIFHILDRISIEKILPEIDQLAFLALLTHLTEFHIINDQPLFLTSDRLETILKLIEKTLSGEYHINKITETVKYLSLFGKIGLKLIDSDRSLLVVDPAGEFQYEFQCELLSNFKDKIVELIKWRSKKYSECDERDEHEREFLNKCDEILKPKIGNLKRIGFENSSQESKKLKIGNR